MKFGIVNILWVNTGAILNTWFDFSPAVGALSSGSASGIGVLGSKSCIPDQPIHVPWHSTTTGATAVTNPPAL